MVLCAKPVVYTRTDAGGSFGITLVVEMENRIVVAGKC
jgi:hypothetical protein